MNKYTKRYKNFDEFCKEFHTVEDVLKWYKTNKIKWPKDRPGKDSNDNPMSWPDNLLKTKIGLCLDHAVFLHYFCTKHNIEHRMLLIQSAVEVEDNIWCIGHAIGLYKTINGVNFFNIQGQEEHSNELGPYKTFEDAVKKYISIYSNMVINMNILDSNIYKINSKPYWVLLDENDCSLCLDRFYNNYKITQNEIISQGMGTFMVKKYGSRYPFKNSACAIIERNFFDIATHDIKKWLSDNIGKPIFALGLPTIETGLMGSTGGVMASAYGKPFVSQIMSSTFVRPKYALHDDIFTDNILTTNDDGILQMMSSDYLKDKKVRVFKYIGKNPKEKMNKILEYAGADVYREFIYETLSGKDMINDEQIYIDEDFEEVKFDEIKASIENEAYSVLNKFINMKPSLASRYSIVNTNEASQKLKGHSDSVVIMEDSSLGYFACNRNSMRRTKYYSAIKDIVIGSDIDE